MYHAITPEAVSVTLTNEGKAGRCSNAAEALETQARAAAMVQGAEKQAAIRRSYTRILARLLEKEKAHTLTEKGLAGLEFMKAANKDCSTALSRRSPEGAKTDAALVAYLLLAWMLAAKAKRAGWLTPKMEAAADMAVGVFMFAGIKLKVTH